MTSSAARCQSPASSVVVGRWLDKGKVAGQCLIQQLGSVHCSNGVLGLGELFVLDQHISLSQRQFKTVVRFAPSLCEGRLPCLDSVSSDYLDVSSAAIQIQVHILDLAILSELVQDILLSGLLVNSCDQHNPALNSYSY